MSNEKDLSWRGLEGTWDRLKWARTKVAKIETAVEAASRAGVDPGTYRAYERQPGKSKHIALDHQKAAHLAKRFKVRWEWLLKGEGEPWLKEDPDRAKVIEAYDTGSEDDRRFLLDVVNRMRRAG